MSGKSRSPGCAVPPMAGVPSFGQVQDGTLERECHGLHPGVHTNFGAPPMQSQSRWDRWGVPLRCAAPRAVPMEQIGCPGARAESRFGGSRLGLLSPSVEGSGGVQGREAGGHPRVWEGEREGVAQIVGTVRRNLSGS